MVELITRTGEALARQRKYTLAQIFTLSGVIGLFMDKLAVKASDL